MEPLLASVAASTLLLVSLFSLVTVVGTFWLLEYLIPREERAEARAPRGESEP